MRGILLTIVSLLFSANLWATQLAQTVASSLNVRATPEGNVIVSLPQYTVVGVMETQGEWTRIMFFSDDVLAPAREGWVSSNYIKPIHSGGSTTLVSAKEVAQD